jgi:hypothetical protein
MRKLILITILGIVIISCGSDKTVTPEGGILGDEIYSGGVARDGIPALTNPDILTVDEAAYLFDTDLVIGVEVGGHARAYPVKIMNYHEIVNDNLGGQDICVTYCPLTGSGIAFNRLVDDQFLEFGVSGLLFRNNLIPYDRTTESLYSQMFSKGIRGENSGFNLPLITSIQCTWGYWKAQHPQTTALSLNTGYSRDYNSNPYGDYPVSLRILFPVRFPDSRFHPKHLTLGIKSGDQALAIPAMNLFGDKVANIVLNETPVVAVYDVAGKMMTAFSSIVNGETLSFTVHNGVGGLLQIIDDQTNSVWTSNGVAIEGPMSGQRLTQLSSYTAYWFAWHDFYPETEVYTGE